MGNTSMREALEAARDLLLPQCNGGTAFAKACGETVNKIMDALKEQRTSDGNAAAMREALKGIVENLRVHLQIPTQTISMNRLEVESMAKDCEAALAKPPRNCDVGTEQEQQDRFREFCRHYESKGECGIGRSEAACPAFQGGRNPDCSLWWANRPYKEGGGK